MNDIGEHTCFPSRYTLGIQALERSLRASLRPSASIVCGGRKQKGQKDFRSYFLRLGNVGIAIKGKPEPFS